MSRRGVLLVAAWFEECVSSLGDNRQLEKEIRRVSLHRLWHGRKRCLFARVDEEPLEEGEADGEEPRRRGRRGRRKRGGRRRRRRAARDGDPEREPGEGTLSEALL